MADTAFTVKVNDRLFVLDKITLGDWYMLKTRFGLNTSDILTTFTNDQGEPVEILNIDDPRVLVGLLVAALHHERPHAAISALVAEVEALTMDGLEFPDLAADGEEEETDAPLDEDDDGEATEAPSKGGNSGKRQKKPGSQSTPKS